MLPGLKPGSIIIGWTYYRDLKVGQILVFNHDGLEKIKRIAKLNINDQTVYVLGDNAALSTDSRDYGWLPISSVTAVVIANFRLHIFNK